MPSRPDLLDLLERYFALSPVPDGPVLGVGALDVPVGTPEWPHPARPRPGVGPVPIDDVRAALAAQVEAGLPEAVEWFAERNPGLSQAARSAGLHVDELPLLLAADPLEVLLPPGVRFFLVGAEDPQLATYQRLAQLAFTVPAGSVAGEATATPTGTAPDRMVDPPQPTDVLRERIAAGRTVLMIAVEDGETVAVGSHQPVDVEGTEVSEIVGVATLPRFRGRGMGAGLASALVEHARETAAQVFLSAGDHDVARVYERVGFARIGTTFVAEPAGD
ncbi:GCN5 family acetyltransferase [Geodermatophilus sp. Leaf369]|uniref:GNAT family N-acetyltransferase n=1 Tax=Geodermatophilus sp. Leaf369 TaxID=1736354 RepID=UPI0006FBBE8B|nr:GNAT family N-acetyltransferase [Geodermatophilus sp. Leaf369]KQS54678.1 GCN5 family acetyltransferase [Geodermatophilus sp. Leaf369]QNG38670.1 GNAT family N-acetyltransferase [Geodermatophilaceae bacterium NBWT11]